MTRLLQALALRERAWLPVLQPRLPGPFERREPLMEPGAGELPAAAPPARPEPAIEAAPGLVVNEPAPLQPVERPTRPAVHDAPAVADTRLEASTLRRRVAASLPAPRSGGEAQAAPHAVPALQLADRMEGRHAGRRLEPPVQRVVAAPAASPALGERAPVAVPQQDSLPLPGRPEVARPSMLPVWAPQAAAPARGHAGERRPDPARLDAPVPAPRAPADVAQQRGNAPSAAEPRQVKLPLAPRAAQALPAAERPIEPSAHARPAQGSLAEAEPRHRLTPAIVLQAQAQAQPAAADDHAAPAWPAGPTVHVSIGRVEIRAAAAPAPGAGAGQASRGKAPPRAPALSLNDYLQQRGGAKRSGGGPGGAR